MYESNGVLQNLYASSQFGSSGIKLKHLSGIKNSERVERLLDASHPLNLQWMKWK